ncbi:MAG: hypothetical protein M3Q22_09295 [Actinomycetota bacterium]|nr:hypothetical protein [Actinomycetota bacterium]
MSWLWILGGLFLWLIVASFVAVVVGRGIRLADRHEAASADVAATGVAVAASPLPAVRERRRAVPLPPLGVALVGSVLALELAGYLTRLNGTSGRTAQIWSMDAPLSVPRMFVAALFGAAAVVAIAAAGRLPERRAWWTAVGLVAAGIAVVKAGSTLHADAFHSLRDTISLGGAVAVSVLVAGVVLGALWLLSRSERRDRLRVLSALALYAGASVGLSAVSSAITGSYGGASKWAAGATFLEETGEALGGVVFLIAVLAGVAPRLVLPAAWPLRRTADAHTLEVAEPLAGRPIAGELPH